MTRLKQKLGLVNRTEVPGRLLGNHSSLTPQSTSSGNFGTSGSPTSGRSFPSKFRSTIPHALAVLATMDILGFLIGQEPNADPTEKNIKLLLNGVITDPQQLYCLVFIYRHGMAHSFFPKEKISIAAHSSLSGKDLFYVDSNATVTLNVNTLIELMKTKFDAILSNTTIHANVEAQFDKLILLDQAKLARRGLNLPELCSNINDHKFPLALLPITGLSHR